MRSRGLVATFVAIGLLGACGGDGTASSDGDAAVTVLARADGWRDGVQEAGGFMLLEVATDAAAERAWDENVPSSLPAAEGDPTEPGVYGTLEDVDLDRRAVVVVSSGGSSSCPPWVQDLRTVADRVEVMLARDDATACTDDFHPYRLVLAVDRDRLPTADVLPVDRVDVPSDNLTDVEGRVVAYPERAR